MMGNVDRGGSGIEITTARHDLPFKIEAPVTFSTRPASCIPLKTMECIQSRSVQPPTNIWYIGLMIYPTPAVSIRVIVPLDNPPIELKGALRCSVYFSIHPSV